MVLIWEITSSEGEPRPGLGGGKRTHHRIALPPRLVQRPIEIPLLGGSWWKYYRKGALS